MDLSNLSDEELEKELIKRKDIKERAAIPQPLDNIDWTPLIECCKQITNDIAERKYDNDDNDHWIYEAVIGCVYGESYFDWKNSIC